MRFLPPWLTFMKACDETLTHATLAAQSEEGDAQPKQLVEDATSTYWRKPAPPSVTLQLLRDKKMRKKPACQNTRRTNSERRAPELQFTDMRCKSKCHCLSKCRKIPLCLCVFFSPDHCLVSSSVWLSWATPCCHQAEFAQKKPFHDALEPPSTVFSEATAQHEFLCLPGGARHFPGMLQGPSPGGGGAAPPSTLSRQFPPIAF